MAKQAPSQNPPQGGPQPQQGQELVQCPSCGTENKGKVKNCRKCGYNLSLPPLWIPDWKWHLKTLVVIYAILIAAYFVIDHFLAQNPPPFDLRDLPPEVTPWIKK